METKFSRSDIKTLAEIGTDYLNLKAARNEPVSDNVKNVIHYCQALAGYCVPLTEYIRNKFFL